MYLVDISVLSSDGSIFLTIEVCIHKYYSQTQLILMFIFHLVDCTSCSILWNMETLVIMLGKIVTYYALSQNTLSKCQFSQNLYKSLLQWVHVLRKMYL